MAISHVFSNTIADGTNTNIVRPSDWNSAHNQYYTLSGNTLGASTVSGTNVVLQGGGNVSLSGTGQTVVVYATGGGVGGGVAIGASTQTATSGTVVFSNSNGISFGLNNGTLTASAAAAPTAYVSSVNGSSGAVTVAGTGTSATNASITLNSNGLAISVAPSPTSYLSNVNGSSGAISLNVGSSLSASTNGSSITFGLASNISTYLQTTGNYLTTARASNDAIGLNTAATNVTWTVNSSGLSLNASGYAGTGTSATNASVTLNSAGLAISVAAPGGGNFSGGVSNLGNTAGSTGITGTRVVFVGTNVISLSQSTDANGGTISISAPATSSLSSGNNISISSNGSTIGISALAIGLNTAATNVTWTANSSGISINASGYAGTGTSATNASVTLNSAGLAISVAAPGGGNFSGGVSNLGNTAGSTGITGTRIAFVGTNNISLSQSTDANGATISINHTGAAGPTAYVSSLNGNSGALSLAVGSSLSSSVLGSTTTFGLASNISTYLQTTGNYLTTARASNDAIGLNTAATNVTWTVNSSGLSLNASGYAGTGFTSTTTAGTAITASLGTNGLNMAVPLYLTAAGGGNFSAGVSNLGNTAGSTGVSGSRIVFVGTNNISLSQSTDANGATISINQTGGGGLTNINVSAGTTSNNLSNIVFSNSNGVTFGLNGSTVTASVNTAGGGGYTASGYSPHADYPILAGQMGQGVLAFDPDLMPNLTMDRVALAVLHSHATNSTGTVTISHWIGLYTSNVSTLSLYASTSNSLAYTFSGTANSVSYSGWRNLTFPWSTSLPEGRYWLAQASRTTTGGANATVSQFLASQINSNFSGIFGVATATSVQFTLGQGTYSATTSGMPDSVAFSQIQGSASLAQRFPIMQFGYQTA